MDREHRIHVRSEGFPAPVEIEVDGVRYVGELNNISVGGARLKGLYHSIFESDFFDMVSIGAVVYFTSRMQGISDVRSNILGLDSLACGFDMRLQFLEDAIANDSRLMGVG
ncbi:MAG: hypothetical protein JKX97_03295 [Candidatus Lindowbacteria bacterium]|nr:hypothetical protein [Candidatus Lindowbacteria bacterium]